MSLEFYFCSKNKIHFTLGSHNNFLKSPQSTDSSKLLYKFSWLGMGDFLLFQNIVSKASRYISPFIPLVIHMC